MIKRFYSGVVEERMIKEKGFDVGRRIVKKLLYKHHFKKQKIQSRRTVKHVANRNEQFRTNCTIKKEYALSTNPIVSVDAKKKDH